MIFSLKVIVLLFSAIILGSSFLPRINRGHWIFRATEYPGIQKFVASLILIVLLYFLYDIYNHWILILQLILLINAIFLFTKFYPYLPLGFLNKTEVKTIESIDDKNAFSFIIANVLQLNTQYKETINQVMEYNPDIFICMETNGEWKNHLDSLTESYPYNYMVPLENLYGMGIYSKLELIDTKHRFLVKDDIPSIRTDIKLKSGRTFTLFIIHPEPPSPTESRFSTNKDKELMLIAKEIDECPKPKVALGDFNDVAWSKTTTLFQKMSGLLDPRKGRGLYSTFHAEYWLIRFPLDQIFISEEFCLVDLKKLPACGSDHFHMYGKIQLSILNDNNSPENPSQEEKEMAKKKIKATPTED